MKKVIFSLLTILLSLVLVSCNKDSEEHLEKPITGIDAIFNEDLGYYNESPSVLKISENVLYLFYTRNETKFDNKTDTIAVRKAVLKDGNWVYGEYKTVLTRGDNKTDFDHKYISSPDVIKGKFNYNGETYNYLMAYIGSNYSNRMNGQIGFAVSKTIDGTYTKVGATPILTFDQSLYSEAGLTNYKGLQEPSLISYDKEGKIQVYYSYYATYNCSYMVEMDCSDLNNIKMGGKMLAENDGLVDTKETTLLYSADFAYNPSRDELVAVRNYSSTVQGMPAVAEAVQVVYANISRAYYEVNYGDQKTGEANVWSLVSTKANKIGAVRTAADDYNDIKKSSGYYRVYNASLFADEYGWIDNPDTLEFIFTSSAVNNSQYLKGEEYKYSQMLHYYSVPFTRDAD